MKICPGYHNGTSPCRTGLDAAQEPHRTDVPDELYQYLDCESSPEGLDEDGGSRVRFLGHLPAGWERIYSLERMAFSDGFVDREAGEIAADLGLGQVF